MKRNSCKHLRFSPGSNLLLLFMIAMSACSSLYYNAMEQVGVHKRDIMVERVKSARDAQEAAKTQFRDALEQFRSVVAVSGGDIEKQYTRLDGVLRKTENSANNIHQRIAAIEDVSRALFREWRREIAQYRNKNYKAISREKYKRTQGEYKELISAMKKAEARLEPALRPLRDQVLFLKHNLNARAIAGLAAELDNIESQVQRLIMEMEAAIERADHFVSDLATGQ